MLERARNSLAIVALALGGGGFGAGLRAYEEGRFRDALAEFQAAERAQGERASAELLYNLALSALRADELLAAEIAAEKAAARGGAEFEPWRDFLLGNAAFRRSALSAQEAQQPEADPTAYERALMHALDAAHAWQRAAVRRPEWAAARRNVERALLEIERLRAQHAEAEKRKETERELEPELEPQAQQRPDEERSEERTRDAALEAQQEPVVSERAERLLELLARKEREKRELRGARRATRSAEVERDW